MAETLTCSGDCHEAREVALQLKAFILEYSVTFCLTGVTLLKLMSSFFRKRIIPKQFPHASEQLPAAIVEEMSVRCTQLLVGITVGLSGYSFLLYQYVTGCSIHEVFLYGVVFCFCTM